MSLVHIYLSASIWHYFLFDFLIHKFPEYHLFLIIKKIRVGLAYGIIYIQIFDLESSKEDKNIKTKMYVQFSFDWKYTYKIIDHLQFSNYFV